MAMARIRLPRMRDHFLYGSYQRGATCCGSFQVVTAVLWLISLGVSFSIAIGGLPGVEKCMEQPLPSPPPPPPTPPPPPPPTRRDGCSVECRGPGGLIANGFCDQACNNAACHWDGGDCRRTGGSQFLDQLLGSLARGGGQFGRSLGVARAEYGEGHAHPTESALISARGASLAKPGKVPLDAHTHVDEDVDDIKYIDVLVHDVISPLLWGVGAQS